MAVEVVVLGNAQDGGVPQAGCHCLTCMGARQDPGQRRWVTSLGLVDHHCRQFWLIDATPDLPQQLAFLAEAIPAYALAGLLLTHAHVGHYAGLIHLGQEVMDLKRLPTYCSVRMGAFLRDNAPWSGLVERRNILLRYMSTGETLSLSPALHLTPLPVPHRQNYSDTMAFLCHGSRQTLLYCPDIDQWQTNAGLLALPNSAACAIALVDGTFFSAAELPERDMAQIPHPLVEDTLSFWRSWSPHTELFLTHLNHTNPLWQDGVERDWLHQQGVYLAEVGRRWELGQ